MDKLSTLSRELYTGGAKLYTSAEKLHTSAEKLYTSAGKLYTSAEKLHTSAGKLYTAAAKLHASADNLHTSAGKLYTSAKKLYTSARGLYTSAIIKRSSNNVYFISPLKYYFVLSHKIKKYKDDLGIRPVFLLRIAEQAVPVRGTSTVPLGRMGCVEYRGLAPPARPVEFRCFFLSPGDGSAVRDGILAWNLINH